MSHIFLSFQDEGQALADAGDVRVDADRGAATIPASRSTPLLVADASERISSAVAPSLRGEE